MRHRAVGCRRPGRPRGPHRRAISPHDGGHQLAASAHVPGTGHRSFCATARGTTDGGPPRNRGRPPATRATLRWAPAAAGGGLVLAAAASAPQHARAAAAQDWPPFVLVAGLLLVGLVADGDGLFAAGGHALARLSPNGVLLYAGTAVLVVTVTTLLNLDTSVTFLTPSSSTPPAAAARGGAAPLRLPAPLQRRVAAPAGLEPHEPDRARPPPPLRARLPRPHGAARAGGRRGHRARRRRRAPPRPAHDHRPDGRARTPGARRRPPGGRRRHGARRGAARAGAPGGRRSAWRRCCSGRGGGEQHGHLGPGRARASSASPSWSASSAWPSPSARWGGRGPAPPPCSSHLDAWGTAAVAALTSVLVNNLPAASLLAARQPPHPFALLIGLNVGPNLFVTGLAGLAPVAAGGAGRRAGSPTCGGPACSGWPACRSPSAAAVGVLVLSGS